MIRILLLATAAALSSCASDLPAGSACEETAECTEGLECLPFATHSGGSCQESGTTCSKLCQTDADCAALGARFKCFALCDARMACGATG